MNSSIRPAARSRAAQHLYRGSAEKRLRTARASRLAWTIFAAAAFLSLTVPARADAIDGDWCAADGRHFSIRGPAITTPGGNAIQGNYRRHSFSYVVPPSEAGAGQAIAMLLLNEEHVAVQTGNTTEVWLRCKPAIS